MKMIKRTLKENILKQLEIYPVVIVSGPRKVGKTTLINMIIEEKKFNYVTLSDISKRKLAVSDPKYFIETHGYPLVIEEIQYAPILLEVIESIVNKKRLEKSNPYGLFILTSTKTFRSIKGQSLAGKASIIEMNPLSLNEIHNNFEMPFVPTFDIIKNKKLKVLKSNEVFDLIYNGFYPELINKNIKKETFYENYINTYIEKEITSKIKNKIAFYNFMEVLASFTGLELSYESISKNVLVSVVTIKEWVNIMYEFGLIDLLQPYRETSLNKRILKRPKIYFTDTGLACFLMKINNPRMLEASLYAPQLLETFVYNEIKKSYTNNCMKPYLYYYRDNNYNEIDFILIYDGILYCIKCKRGMLFNSSATKAFDCLNKTIYEIGDSCIISLTDSIYAIKRGVYVYPITVV